MRLSFYGAVVDHLVFGVTVAVAKRAVLRLKRLLLLQVENDFLFAIK
jgi:hypothetical protein